MKLNYKAIGMRIRSLRESNNKTIREFEDYLGPQHIDKMNDYENGLGLDKDILIKIADFFNTSIKFYHSLLSWGDIKKSPNLLSLHIQHKFNKENINVNTVLKRCQISRSTFNNWISGRSIPSGDDAIFRIAELLETTFQVAEILLKKSQILT